MRPTVVVNLSDNSRLMTEEIFGPVVCVVPFDMEEEVSINMFRSRERSGSVLDSRLRVRGLKPHQHHCVVVLEQDTFILA